MYSASGKSAPMIWIQVVVELAVKNALYCSLWTTESASERSLLHKCMHGNATQAWLMYKREYTLMQTTSINISGTESSIWTPPCQSVSPPHLFHPPRWFLPYDPYRTMTDPVCSSHWGIYNWVSPPALVLYHIGCASIWTDHQYAPILITISVLLQCHQYWDHKYRW